MDLRLIPAGENPPTDVNAVIEIPLGGVPVKYELDKSSGALFVDRFLHTAMFYPGNYGFIPHTLSADGDPCDVLVVTQVSVVPGAVIRCRPVGALIMEDEAGADEKIIAVPVGQAPSLLFRRPQLCRSPACHVRADRAFFPALQRSREGQVGYDRPLAGCGRRGSAGDGGDSAGERSSLMSAANLNLNSPPMDRRCAAVGWATHLRVAHAALAFKRFAAEENAWATRRCVAHPTRISPRSCTRRGGRRCRARLRCTSRRRRVRRARSCLCPRPRSCRRSRG